MFWKLDYWILVLENVIYLQCPGLDLTILCQGFLFVSETCNPKLRALLDAIEKGETFYVWVRNKGKLFEIAKLGK